MFVIKHAKSKGLNNLNIDLYHDIHQLRPYLNQTHVITYHMITYSIRN